MKGLKKQIKNVKKYKGGGTSKRSRRAHLHSGNHAYNTYMHTHKIAIGLDGTPQGKHDVKQKDTCSCGGCINRALGV
jgi:hypothetical protein